MRSQKESGTTEQLNKQHATAAATITANITNVVTTDATINTASNWYTVVTYYERGIPV